MQALAWQACPPCIAFTPRPLHSAFDPAAIQPGGRSKPREKYMLKWAIIFAIVSLISGWLGFGGVSGATATIAKVLFVCFVILFVLALLAVIGVFHLVL
jgi:uncharacterized membrane protein YtjA (UPF0391 family)